MYDIAIIGGGPAGIAASIYAARAGYNAVVFEKLFIGGQLVNTNEIDNYPGFGSISGFDLIEKFNYHLKSFNTEIILSEVTEIQLMENIKIIKTPDNIYKAKAVIITVGATPAKLNVKGEDQFRGRGVSYCATCDGAFFKGKITVVVGGGNTAAHDAIFLSKFCDKVYIIHRRGEFRADQKTIKKMNEIPNIVPVMNSVLDEIRGSSKVESVIVSNVTDSTRQTLNVEGVFIAVGTIPNTMFLNNCSGLELDSKGAIITNLKMETNVPGVFAAGDARNTPLRQIVTAAADGAVAAYHAAVYLSCAV